MKDLRTRSNLELLIQSIVDKEHAFTFMDWIKLQRLYLKRLFLGIDRCIICHKNVYPWQVSKWEVQNGNIVYWHYFH